MLERNGSAEPKRTVAAVTVTARMEDLVAEAAERGRPATHNSAEAQLQCEFGEALVQQAKQEIQEILASSGDTRASQA